MSVRKFGHNIINFWFFIFLICTQNIHAQDDEITNVQNIENSSTQQITEASNAHGIKITNMEGECSFIADFNRTFNFVGSFSITGKIEFNNRLVVKGGFSLSLTQYINNIKTFAGASFHILSNWPLYVKLAWAYNGFPEYETHSHAIAPFISWDAKYFGMSVGFGFLLTSFFSERPMLEFLLPVGIYVNFINNEKLCVGMSFANYTDFQMDKFIAFAIATKATVRINEHFSIFNEFEYRQSGVEGFTATFHGIVWKGGAKLTW